MENVKTEYLLFTAYIKDFSEKLNNLCEEGWSIHGNLTTVYVSHSDCVLHSVLLMKEIKA